MYNSIDDKQVFSLAHYIAGCILVLISIMTSSPVNANEAFSETQYKNYSELLSKTEKQLKKQAYNEQALPEVIKSVTPIKSTATQCISSEQSSLEKFKLDLDSLGQSTKGEDKEVRQKRRELQTEIETSEKKLAGCRVLLLRSEEMLNTLSDYQQTLLSERLFAAGTDINTLIQENWNKPLLLWQSVRTFVVHNSGVELLSVFSSFVLVTLLLLTYMVGHLLRKTMVKSVNLKSSDNSFSNHFKLNLLNVISCYIPYLLMSLMAVGFFYFLTREVKTLPFLSLVVFGSPIYLLLKLIIELFLKPVKDNELFESLPEHISLALARRLNVLLLLSFMGYLLFTTLELISLPDNVYLLVKDVFAVVFLLNIIWAVWLLGKIPRFENLLALRYGASFILFVVLIIELSGYRNLSGFIAFGIAGSLLALGIFLLLSKLITEFFDGLEKGKKKWQKSFRDSLGVKKRKRLPELGWLKLIVLIALWLSLIVALLQFWGVSEAGFTQLNTFISDGFTVGSLQVIPARIVLAIIVLMVMLALNSWFRTRLEQSWLLRTNIERGAREATATISGYIGVALAILVSLSVAGVEFGNLAIIAGALSVGIGFGLQNIVNNFVSGLILLFERPIKTGDWIVVGNTEGFVKRISIRSTQIQTFDQADVIVPNSELISGQVTNWMLRDVRGRIIVPVGVAYGSDTELVSKVLLEIASQHELVVNDGRVPEPKVMFMSFGDSALLFELRVFIENIDKKFQAISDLNYAIDKAFREHQIEIPFPQRDIHIKSGKLE